jgi:HD-like signal output (HDOD) protein
MKTIDRKAGDPPFAQEIQRIIQKDATIPVFSTTALKLLDIANDEDLDMDTVVDIVKLDPGLTTKYLRLANSVWIGGKSISDLRDALVRIGMNEVRHMASTIGVMEVLALFKKETKTESAPLVEWEMFWLHSLLAARLTDVIASAYRSTTGKEYLSGLLHDSGKLFLEKYFPGEFASVVQYSIEQSCSLHEAEMKLLQTSHAEIGGALSEKWRLHSDITHAISHHHRELKMNGSKSPSVDGPEFLTTCLCVANSLANACEVNIQLEESVKDMDVEELPEWRHLQDFPARQTLELDVVAELQKAQESIQILTSDPKKGR